MGDLEWVICDELFLLVCDGGFVVEGWCLELDEMCGLCDESCCIVVGL